MVTLFFFLILGCVVSWFAIKNHNILLGVIAAPIWIILFYYTRSTYPLGSWLAGSAGDTMTIVVFFGLAIGVPLVSWSFWRGQKKYDERNEAEWHNKEDQMKAKKNPTYSDVTDASNSIDLMNMSDQEYMNVLQGKKPNK